MSRAKPKKRVRSTAKLHPYQESDAEFFKDVVFLVEATHHEQHQFWHDWHYVPRYEGTAIEFWEQVMEGRMITIGQIDRRPVTICINWAYLNGYKVMFYEGTSQVVDHQMVERWIDHFASDIKWDNGYRRARTDSNNFHSCIHAIQELVEKKGKGPGSGRPFNNYFRLGEKRKEMDKQDAQKKRDKKLMDLITLSINNPSNEERLAAANKALSLLNSH